MVSDSRLVNEKRHVTMVSGEMYPECGILRRVRETRPVADKRSLGSEGNEMQFNSRVCRRGACPPRNQTGRAGVELLRIKKQSSARYVSAGNCPCIAETDRSNRDLLE